MLVLYPNSLILLQIIEYLCLSDRLGVNKERTTQGFVSCNSNINGTTGKEG